MSGKKGMKKYPIGIREKVVERIRAGESQQALSREYGISRWAFSAGSMNLPFPKREGANLQKHWQSTSTKTNG